MKVCCADPRATGRGLVVLKAGTNVDGLPEAEAGLGVGALEIPGAQRAMSSPKRHQRLGVNLLLWRDKSSTSHRGRDL